MRLQRPSIPPYAVKVTTYDELGQFAHQFVARYYSLLLIIGEAGLGKSQVIQRAVGNRSSLYLETHATAFDMYRQLYKHRDEPVVVDDLDHIYSDKAAIRLLKSLCNTDPSKTLRWNSAHRDIGEGVGQIPDTFNTTSPVCLIANEWRTSNANVLAIEDRAIVLHFRPSVGEIHVHVRNWFKDMEVYHFIEDQLRYLTRLSMRYYVKGAAFKRANPEHWRQHLLAIMGVDERKGKVVQLLRDSRFKTDAQRVAEFKAKGYGSRATYYRLKQELTSSGQL